MANTRSTDELAVILMDLPPGPERDEVMVEYEQAIVNEAGAEDYPAPVELHERRVMIKGVGDGSVSSIETLLTQHLGLLLGDPGPIRLNELSGQIEHAGTEYDLNDLVTRLRISCERRVCFETEKLDEQGRRRKAKLRLPVEDTKAVALQLARGNRFNPVREWLERLPPVEPGAIRLSATEALGLSDELSLTLWRKWLIACVARVMDPGCQVDTVLVLVAPQGGEGKSSMFRALVGNAWFSDTYLDMVGHKRENAYMQLHSVWLYEIQELEGAQSKTERSRMKSFLVSRFDKFRAPYDATVKDHPRAMAFGASTNSKDFLSSADPAFSRRFWPINIGTQIDVAMVARLRPQIWAEALAAYRSGEEFHLDASQTALLDALSRRHAEMVEEDPWVAEVDSFLGERQSTTIKELLVHFKVDIVDDGRGQHSAHLAACLRQLGWTADPDRTSQAGVRARRWRAPQAPPGGTVGRGGQEKHQ